MKEFTINRRRKLSVRTKLLFASGAMQEAVVTAGGIVTVLFYNQVLGVSPALAGTAFLIASIFDAVSDPLIGAISDRFHSRWGRRHPFMFASALPIAVSFYLLYQPPDGLGETKFPLAGDVPRAVAPFSDFLSDPPRCIGCGTDR